MSGDVSHGCRLDRDPNARAKIDNNLLSLMKRSTPFLLLLPALLILAQTATAQIAVDVKTPWNQKYRLRGLKSGLSAAIDAAPWARTTEFGEDYVVMLRDLERRRGGGDTVIATVSVELRTPSFFGSGDQITGRQVEIRYCGIGLDSLARNLSGVGKEGSNGNSTQQMVIHQLLSLGVDMLPISSPLVKTLLVATLSTLEDDPDPTEIAEGTLLALKVVGVVDQMLLADAQDR